MQISTFNYHWKFWEVTNSFALNWAPPEDAALVDLPHDAMIETPQDPDAKAGANTGYRKGGVYSYSKTLTVHDPAKHYILKIEGAYMNAFVYVNGQLAGKRPFGYTVFYVFLNPYLNFGEENEIRIQVRAGAEPNSRWYPGNGLYRDVYLLEGGAQFIQPDSVRIQTLQIPSASGQSVQGNAVIEVSSMISVKDIVQDPVQDSDEDYTLEITVTDMQGTVVANRLTRVENIAYHDDSPSAYLPYSFAFLPVTTQIQVPSPCLWDVDTPYLYQCTLALKDAAGNVLDTHTDSFGIRMLDLNSEEGLKVNGRTVKLRGTCIHHDSGMLGAKTYEETHIRQLRKLKEAGFNAIRSAHNPAAPALLRACDKVGMYVMDEAFDMWTRNKSDYDYGLYFDEWWEADIAAMVKNAFNHPSVLMYSIGNEITEIGMKKGEEITRMICEVIKSFDNTRYTLASVNGIFSVGNKMGQIVADVAADLQSQGRSDGNVNDFMAFMHAYMNDMVRHPIVDETISIPFRHTDIGGYNYMGHRYPIEHELHPERVIVGSESGIADIAENWAFVKELPYVIGDFCWTGWEYLGEAGIGSPNYSDSSNPFGNAQFPLQISGTGSIDITGYRLPMSYYREIVFGLRKDPYIAVKDPAHYGENLITNPWIISDAIGSWSWSEYDGKPVSVEVYSDADEVELLQDGVSLGRQPAGSGVRYISRFETTWKPGELTAVSYTDGEETGRYTIRSAETEPHLELTLEPVYSETLPSVEYPEIPQIANSSQELSQEFGAAASDVQKGLQDSLASFFEKKDPMGSANFDSSAFADQMKSEYEASRIRAKELSEQLKASYLNGTAGKPELVLDPGDSQLLQTSPDVSEAVSDGSSESNHPDPVGGTTPAEPVKEAIFYEGQDVPEPQIRFISIEILDDNGVLATDQKAELHITLEGDARILAFGSADPKPTHNYNEAVTDTWLGRAQLIILQPAGAAPSRIMITSDIGLKGALEI